MNLRRLLLVAILLSAFAAASAPAGAATAPRLRAGAGQADITPPQTGYFLGGWTRADRLALGQSTRLYANALVLQRGTTKVALVAAELFGIPAGLQEDVARKVADLGYDRTTILLAASHTHSAPGGFTNNPTYNTAAPSPETIGDPSTFVNFLNPKPADRQLYTFLVDQIAAAIRRADADRAPAAAGWARTDLYGVTVNRSIEAHLADHGIDVPLGQGTPQMDPLGVNDTIDPEVDVLRVDKLVRTGRGKHRHTVHVPIGAYSNFADHGTVVKSENQVYSGDHHATAWRVFVDRVRKASKHLPRAQTVVNVYPNGDEGDQSAGLTHTGIEGAMVVGTAEAGKMFEAWRAAGRHLSRTPALDVRWSKFCFCGQMTATGPVASQGVVGAGFLTGSEEGRGPLYDLTHIPLEGKTSPFSDPVQGDKIQVLSEGPAAVPLSLTRIGDGVLVGVPGEPTKQVGTHLREAIMGPLAPLGIRHAVIAGLADEYIQYITTPQEYGTQSYEGASTLYGQNEATFLQERYVDLAHALADGRPAPKPYPLDVAYGVKPDGPAYPAGAASGTITAQPPAGAVTAGTPVTIRWDGGPLGRDRPVDRAFAVAERQVRGGWRIVDSDLGLHMLWHVDDKGHYDLTWSMPAGVPAGTYRLRVTATRYELTTSTFGVSNARR